MAESDASTSQCVKIKPFEQFLERLSYPITVEELVERHGEHTLEQPNGDQITVAPLFEGVDHRTYASKAYLRRWMLDVIRMQSAQR